MSELSTTRLLAFACRLQRTSNFFELVEAAHAEVRDALGYAHAWFMVADDDSARELRLIEYVDDRRSLAWDVSPVLKVDGDAFLETLIASDVPIVIEDARVDPRTNKQLVAQRQSRTIINVPLRLLDKPFGIFGIGTLGDEGCRVPRAGELEYLVGMAGQLSVAAGRLRSTEVQSSARREKVELERKLNQIQRLESLGLLAGGIAHDFNNLLTVILSGISLAERASSEPWVIDDLQLVTAAANRARDLTAQLMAMNQSQDLQIRPLDLNVRLAELTAILRRVFPETIAIDLIRVAHLPAIEGDASQLDQVFMNLCINARDAMPEGGRLTLETEQLAVNGRYAAVHPWVKPGRYVLVTISDTGVGIAADQLERIFEPFFTTKGPQTGTGLGLAVAYGIVRQHGGILQCYSELGVGTTFKVYLPAFDQRPIEGDAESESDAPRGHERILLAEDDPGVRDIARRILESAGYEVIAVESGDAALRVAKDQSFDLALLDVVMPGLSCAETVARLRELRPRARLLLASGYTAGSNVVQPMADAQLLLISKPYDPDELLRRVRHALDG
jgi:signal transduction histidine kinase